MGGGGGVGLGLGVDRGALIGDLGDITVVVVSGVGHGLDSAIGKGNLVRSLNVTGGISGLRGLEVSLGVVIGDSVLESIGSGLTLLNIRGRGVVDNRGGMVGGGLVDNGGGVVDNRGGVVGRGSVVDRGVVDGGSVMDNGVTAMGPM